MITARRVRNTNERSGTAMNLHDFIQANREHILQKTEADMKRGENGSVLISRNDEWFHEDEWDELYEQLVEREK